MALRRSDPSQTGGDINAAEVAVEVDAEASPALGLLLVAPGPQQRLGSVRTLVDHEYSSFVVPEPAAIGMGKDGPALARSVLDAETQVLGLAKQASYALAVVEPRRVVDHATATMDVDLRIRPGPGARLARPTFAGARGWI